MDPVVVIILGIIVVLFVLDWLNRNRPRPWRSEPQRSADADISQNPSGIPPIGGDGGASG
jgi:hypothetical protein